MVSSDVGSKKLKVRPDVFFVRSDDGVWLRNNVGSFFVKGPKSYELLRSLLPRMDGTNSLNDLSGSLRPEQLYERVLEPLLQRGFLSDIGTAVETVPEWVDERYREQLAFLEQYVDRPVERLLRVRSRRVVCVGSGLLLRALVVALVDLGFANLQVLVADDEIDAQALRDVLAAQTPDGFQCILDIKRATSKLDDLLRGAEEWEASAIIIATAGAQFDEVAATSAMLRLRGHTVGVVAPVGTFLATSPLMSDENWCWECLFRSVVTNNQSSPAAVPAALATFQIAQRLFCRFAGPPVPEDRSFTTIDCETLSVAVHQPRQHATCGWHTLIVTPIEVVDLSKIEDAPIRTDLPTSRDSDELISAQDRIIETLKGWIDGITGPLLSISEENLPQLPLSASRCRIRTPSSLPGATDIRTIQCQAISPREARNQVALLTLESLAEARMEKGKANGNYVGAGWSLGEAVYRALLTASLDQLLSSQSTADSSIEDDNLPTSAVRKFLLETLADLHGDCVSFRIQDMPSGLVGARMTLRDDTIVCGVGLDVSQAVDHALTRALTNHYAYATTEVVVTAYPAPAFGRWSELMNSIAAKVLHSYKIVDLQHLLPFVGRRARIVGLSPTGNAWPGAGK